MTIFVLFIKSGTFIGFPDCLPFQCIKDNKITTLIYKKTSLEKGENNNCKVIEDKLGFDIRKEKSFFSFHKSLDMEYMIGNGWQPL